MRSYIVRYGVYIFAGFVVVFLTALGVMAIIRLKGTQKSTIVENKPTPIVIIQPTPTPADNYAQVSFSLETTPTPAATATGWECTKLVASATEGTAPFTVKFTATAKKPTDATAVSYEFVFGDTVSQTIEKVSSIGTTSENQDINHTYTKSGNFKATARILDASGKAINQQQVCSLDIAVGGLLAQGPTVAPTNTPIPTKTVASPTPTVAATATQIPSATETPIPVPKLPQSGGVLPTVFSAIGGVVVILLGILI